MNYLAHAFLSGSSEELLVGNFIADHLRGNDFGHYSQGIRDGIRLHRQIDTFTDGHLLFRESKRLFYKNYEKYSGILVDIYFDHLLARNFERHSSLSLAQFSRRVYDVYSRHHRLIPPSGLGFLDYVIRNNIYTAYADPAGIKKVLFHLSHRIRHNVRLDRSLSEFSENEKTLSANFEIFFGEATREFLNTEN